MPMRMDHDEAAPPKDDAEATPEMPGFEMHPAAPETPADPVTGMMETLAKHGSSMTITAGDKVVSITSEQAKTALKNIDKKLKK
jgi:hypothetical protein